MGEVKFTFVLPVDANVNICFINLLDPGNPRAPVVGGRAAPATRSDVAHTCAVLR